MIFPEAAHQKIIYGLVVGDHIAADIMHQGFLFFGGQDCGRFQQKAVFIVAFRKRQVVGLIEFLVVRHEPFQTGLLKTDLFCSQASDETLLYVADLFKVVAEYGLISFQPRFFAVYVKKLMEIILRFCVGKLPSGIY